MSKSQTSENGLAFLISLQNEPTKQYIEYDIDNRPYRIYMAHFLAKDGDPCSITLYEYVGNTSQVQRLNEFVGTWVSATMNSQDANTPDELKQ